MVTLKQFRKLFVNITAEISGTSNGTSQWITLQDKYKDLGKLQNQTNNDTLKVTGVLKNESEREYEVLVSHTKNK